MDQKFFEEFESSFNKRDLERQIVDLERNITTNEIIEDQSIYRQLHSLKGLAGFFRLKVLVDILHKIEDVMQIIVSYKGRITKVKDANVFNTLLRGLDLIEDVKNALYNDPMFALEDDRSLYQEYMNIIRSCNKICAHTANYFEIKELDRSRF